ncbi:hypothetical protein Tco_0703436 [Tanacetum coccineum]|uniref:Uncharacterized protein n=1 Tax=Tanacetum coccineum TaxID=301880 RepID=A0ABQ4XZT7_9ASTR
MHDGQISPANIDSDEGPSYDFAFISEVQSPSTRYMNPLFIDNNHEQTYHEQPKIMNSTIGDDQINSNVIFDDSNVEVNNGSVEHDKYVHDSYKLEQLARNAYKEVEKDKIRALEKGRDDLQLNVSQQRKHVLELQNAQTVLKQEVKSMMDIFESMESDLDVTWKQNEILNDQLLEATLKHDVEKCVLMCNDLVNDKSLDEIEKVKRESIDVEENLLKRIKILENDFQRCQKHCIDYELQLQH